MQSIDMSMSNFLVLAVIVALCVAFFVTLLHKWGFVEYMQIHGDDFLHKLFSCDFCISFWISAVIALFLVAVFTDISLLLIPILSTPLAKFLQR